MVKIYTEHQFLNSNYRREVFPLLFDLVYSPNDKTASNYCFTDSVSEADLAIFPVDIIAFAKKDKDDFLKNWLEKITEQNLPIWVYAGGDFGGSLENKNVYSFRFGTFKSTMNSYTYLMPCFVGDPYDKILKDDFALISKKTKPNIGFVGNADGSFIKYCKEFLLYAKQNIENLWSSNFEEYHPFYPSSSKRYHFLQRLMKDSRIESDFIFRKKYRAKNKNKDNIETTTLEFFKNIQDNLYVFCLRGKGNFSVRFYETLIMGRIPVLIDTDVSLPLSDKIDWKQHCLLVSAQSFVEDLVQFHSSKTDSELKQMQLSNRELMLNKLNRIDYFIQLAVGKNKSK